MTQRLDLALVRAGLARSRGQAAELIRNRQVMLAGNTATKPAQPVNEDQLSRLQVISAPAAPLASRAGEKLAGALDALGPAAPQIAGRRCLDVGASTGGFTDVLLREGASQVVALDVGHGQLREEIRQDPRVQVLEGINARYLDPQLVAPAPELVVADVSFISLTLILPAVLAALAPEFQGLVMVKPQFEVGKERLGASGVVTSPQLHVESVLQVARVAQELGARVSAVVPSPLPGPHGNREFFIHLKGGAEVFPQPWPTVVELATAAVHA